MKHLARVTVAKADDGVTVDVNALMAQIFSFIVDVMTLKGKGGTTTLAEKSTARVEQGCHGVQPWVLRLS